MDLAFNNQQRLICHKTQSTNQIRFIFYHIIYSMYDFEYKKSFSIQLHFFLNKIYQISVPVLAFTADT